MTSTDPAEGRRPPPPLRVTHYGPCGDTAGGIASVIRAYERLPWQSLTVQTVNTYRPGGRLWSVSLLLRALARLVVDRRRPNPPVVHVHLSQRGSFLREGTLVRVAHRLGYGVAVSVHGSRFELFAARHARLVRGVLADADVVLTLGSRMSAAVHALLPSARVEPVVNPVALGPRPSAAPRSRTVLFGGELSTRKGVDVLLAAWPGVRDRCPEARLCLAGPAHSSLVLREPPAGVEVAGGLAHAEFLRRLGEAVLLVLPSRAEAMPMAVLEAMAQGVPVVVSDVGALPEVVGDAGLVVPAGRVDDLRDSLLELLEDEQAAVRLGLLGWQRVRDRFDERVVERRLSSVYEELLPRRPSGSWGVTSRRARPQRTSGRPAPR